MAIATTLITSEEELDQIVREKYTDNFLTEYIIYDGVFLPKNFCNYADKIENFQVRDDDIWVCSFPKTGTTWTQEMVWCLANNLDFEKAKIIQTKRFPYLELSAFQDCTNTTSKTPEKCLDSIDCVNKMPSPRFIKSHLPFHLLPKQIKTGEKKPKIIYINRNVKDCCISYFHHCKDLSGYRFTFEEFCSLFLAGKVKYGPFWNHVLQYWERRNQENILFLKYEDMKVDLQSVLRDTSKFLSKEALTESDIETLKNHLSFEKMKDNPSVNYVETFKKTEQSTKSEKEGKFMRSGKMNQWRERMSNEIINQFDSWTEESLKDTNFVN